MDALAANRRTLRATHIDEIEKLSETYRAAPITYVQVKPGRLGAAIYDTSTPRVEVREASFQTEVILAVDAVLPRFALGVCLSGMAKLFGRALGSSNVGYLNGRNGVFAAIRGGSAWCNVSVDQTFIHEVAETHRYQIPRGDDSYGLSSAKRHFLARSISQLARGTVHGAEFSAAQFEDQVALLTLRALNPPRVRERPHSSHRNTIVRRAVDYIHAHFADKLTITQLCSVAGVSERTLLYAFTYMFDISPQQYLMHHRLEQAREILKCGSTAEIADVAHACGIHHAGRFAAYFKDKYGESPSNLLAKEAA